MCLKYLVGTGCGRKRRSQKTFPNTPTRIKTNVRKEAVNVRSKIHIEPLELVDKPLHVGEGVVIDDDFDLLCIQTALFTADKEVFSGVVPAVLRHHCRDIESNSGILDLLFRIEMPAFQLKVEVDIFDRLTEVCLGNKFRY